jgi:UDP-N-acetyl-D-mannosaminuronic acid dehydrogenase
MLIAEEDEKIIAKNKKIIVVGTGYVGLPAAILLARSGYKVIGVDIDKNVVNAINNGVLHIREKEIEEIFNEEKVRKNLFSQEIACEGDIFIIAVPTPLDKRKKIADLSIMIEALKSIIPFLKKDNLIIIESTIPPLTCREIIKPLVEHETNLIVNQDIFIAHCPERILPGNVFQELVNNDRIIGGMNKKAAILSREIYSSFVKGELYITDDVTAEFCKLVENTYRDVNIALANEIDQVSETLGIDSNEIISLANMHPRVDLLRPGIGVGGHCIPIDPWFIKQVDPKNTSLIFTARRINEFRPLKISKKIRMLLQNVKDPKIVILGLTYKPNTYDIRESPSLLISQDLKEDGYNVECYDPFVEEYSYSDILDIVKGKDCLAVLVEHDKVKDELKKNLEKIKARMNTPIVFRPTS